MELRGRLIDIVKDWLTGEMKITLGVRTVPTGIESLREGDLRISLARWREKRSLTANAYYWVLVAKIADAIHQAQPVVHNLMLRQYGQLEYVDGETVTMPIPDTEEAEQKVLRAEEYHLRPTSHIRTGKDGKQYRIYRMMRGSSDYDSKEMATLIDGTIQEAKDLGIETLPPEQIERMKEDYEKHYSNRHR